MKARTHFAEASKVSFDYGPYLISEKIEGVANVEDLERPLHYLSGHPAEKANGIAKLRQWSAALHNDRDKAEFMRQRIEQINKGLYEGLELENMLEKLKKDDDRTLTVKAEMLKFGANDKEGSPDFKSKVNDLLLLSSF